MTRAAQAPLYAWAWPPTRTRINEWRDRFPGLRLVHYPGTVDHARDGDAAMVKTLSEARAAIDSGTAWSFVILDDEANVTGPSGTRKTVEAYNAAMAPIDQALRSAGFTTAHAGLAMAGGRFDEAYARQIRVGTARGQNYRMYRWRRMKAGIETFPQDAWFVTALPLRLNWWPLKYLTLGSWLRERFTRPGVDAQLRALRSHPQVFGVGVWCLHEGRMGNGHWQAWHGLLDRHDRPTSPGRIVARILSEGRSA